MYFPGAPNKSKPILSVLAGLHSQQEQLDAARAEEAQLRQQLRQLEGAVEQHGRLQGELDTKSHQATLLRTRIEQSAHGRLELEMKALETEIGESEFV